ncbi:MAG: molybdopterin converting factor subunit 1 [Pseudomonadota bacterium]
MIQLRFFARIREQLATDSEEIPVDGHADVETVVTLLRQRGGIWSEVFANDQSVLVAVNQEVSDVRTPIKDGDEVAFFPPVTGG